MGRREGPSEERRAAILEAAQEVFTANGYGGASIREIAKRAGVSPALLYWFFPSKEKLFAGVLVAGIDALGVIEFPPEVMEVPPEDFLPRIAQGVTMALAGGRQAGLMKLALRESGREVELMGTLSEALTGRVLRPLAAYLTRQMELGRLRGGNPDYMAQVLLGPMMALAVRRELLREPTSRAWDVGDYAETAVQLFLRGAMLPPGSAPQQPVPLPEATPTELVSKEVRRIEIEA